MWILLFSATFTSLVIGFVFGIIAEKHIAEESRLSYNAALKEFMEGDYHPLKLIREKICEKLRNQDIDFSRDYITLGDNLFTVNHEIRQVNQILKLLGLSYHCTTPPARDYIQFIDNNSKILVQRIVNGDVPYNEINIQDENNRLLRPVIDPKYVTGNNGNSESEEQIDIARGS